MAWKARGSESSSKSQRGRGSCRHAPRGAGLGPGWADSSQDTLSLGWVGQPGLDLEGGHAVSGGIRGAGSLHMPRLPALLGTVGITNRAAE